MIDNSQNNPIKNIFIQPDVKSLPNIMVPNNENYQKTNLSLSQNIIFPNGISKSYTVINT